MVEHIKTYLKNLPKYIEVDVAAYWLIPRFFTWFGASLLKNISPFFNLCQIIIIKIPRNLTKSCDFAVCKDIGIGPSQSIRVEKRDCTVNSLQGKLFNLDGQNSILVDEGML